MIKSDNHATCTWPGCPKPPVVNVKYMRARDSDQDPEWLAAKRGLAAVCERHALELCEALGVRQWLGLTQLAA
jgi:hypothetical protein